MYIYISQCGKRCFLLCLAPLTFLSSWGGFVSEKKKKNQTWRGPVARSLCSQSEMTSIWTCYCMSLRSRQLSFLKHTVVNPFLGCKMGTRGVQVCLRLNVRTHGFGNVAVPFVSSSVRCAPCFPCNWERFHVRASWTTQQTKARRWRPRDKVRSVHGGLRALLSLSTCSCRVLLLLRDDWLCVSRKTCTCWCVWLIVRL
jgi:hypothetical protein